MNTRRRRTELDALARQTADTAVVSKKMRAFLYSCTFLRSPLIDSARRKALYPAIIKKDTSKTAAMCNNYDYKNE